MHWMTPKAPHCKVQSKSSTILQNSIRLICHRGHEVEQSLMVYSMKVAHLYMFQGMHAGGIGDMRLQAVLLTDQAQLF